MVTKVKVQDSVELAYETFGDPADPAVLLIAGLGAQMISWASGLCELIAAGGRHVIRYDNRDCGASTWLDGEALEIGEIIAAASAGDFETARRLASYSLRDLAADAAGLLAALDIDSAHIVGASMGGMIAQVMAVEFPERVATLTSIMSTTGESDVGQPSDEALAALLTEPRSTRADYIEDFVESSRVWGSKRHFNDSEVAALAAETYDRGVNPQGTVRQLAAVLSRGSAAKDLAALRVPTLVIHGLDDVLISPSGGVRTAELVPGARLELIEDMGHDRPTPLWPDLAGLIIAHTGG